MSGRIYQSVIVQLKEITDKVIGVMDGEGNVQACSALNMVGLVLDGGVQALLNSGLPYAVHDGWTLCALGSITARLDSAVFVQGEDSESLTICRLAAIAFNEVKLSYEEKFDKSVYIKNIISDNTLLVDLYSRAKELRIDVTAPRGVLLIRQPEKVDSAAVEILQSLFPDRQKDFIFSVNDTDVVLIKELTPGSDGRELDHYAQQIVDTLTSELFLKPVIGVGSVSNHLRQLAERYKEAQVAIEVGKVFDDDKMIIHYDNLGIGRIIYKLPRTLCEMFLDEVFKKSPIDALDQETLDTINRFFENNLNVSETSRKLFVHRNTLVYRLEKIKKLTGLDLREFDHAIVFKVALMVKKYLNSQDQRL
ncbi:MAG: helix-turn-helix domain-containing protein [Oscillospiraceae bacterium]|nr:helix-turn-helix domain-containing protein [Oscillospiraceae bacterium]